MLIGEVLAMSNDSKPNFSGKGVKVQRRETSNTNFRGHDTIPDVTNLSRESNVLERVKEARGKPVARASKKFSLKVLKEVVNLDITRGELPNIRKQGHDKDIGSQDVIEEASTQVFPSLYRIGAFLDSIVELRVS